MSQLSFDDFLARVDSKQIKIVYQLVVGRGGSLFLHSLLDNHPRILSYPGILNFYEAIMDKTSQKGIDLKKTIAEELALWNEVLLPYNVQHNLGSEKNISIEIDCNQIAEMACSFAGTKSPDRRILFLALNYAIGCFFKRDLDEVRVIYCQEHTSHPGEKIFSNAMLDFPEAKFLCILRDPRANYISTKSWEEKRYAMNIKAWEVQQFEPGLYADLCIYWYATLLKFANKYAASFHIIRLEDLQAAKGDFMKKLSTVFQVDFSPTMLETTFNGFTWHGDNFSPKQSGFRSSANPSKWQTELPKIKQVIIEIILEKELKALNYPRPNSHRILLHVIAWLLFSFWLWDDLNKMLMRRTTVAEQQKGFATARNFLFAMGYHLKSSLRLLKFIRSNARFYHEISKTIITVK